MTIVVIDVVLVIDTVDVEELTTNGTDLGPREGPTNNRHIKIDSRTWVLAFKAGISRPAVSYLAEDTFQTLICRRGFEPE